MRVAVISDIHGNLHALEAVLADIDRQAPDEIWCLGDVVGYGPRPNDCVALARERATVSLCGNHDLAVIGTLDVADFSGDAAAAVRWTQGVLDSEARDWLASLQPTAVRPGADLYHGSPRDPVWDYVLSEEVARLCLLETTAPIVLVGHSHVALALAWDGDAIEGGLAPEGTEAELSPRRWLLNPGSVGQPRDGDARAAWLLVDDDASRATFRRVTYPIDQTQAEIREQGLPAALAARIAHGV
jgi:diadenosine tetraphosphatase ApaH/serine/threonine PP2A family protein phosphatase